MSRLRRPAAAAGALLLLAYALPLFCAPAATPPLSPGLGAGLWQRLFPGVPEWWVAGRLACLLAGAALVAAGIRSPLPLRLGDVRRAVPTHAGDRRRAWGLRIALALAFVQAIAGLFAARFDRLAETLYFAFLAAPAAVLLWGEAEGVRRFVSSRAAALALLLVAPGVWLAWSAPTAWRSPRAASLVDMWLQVQRLGEVVLRHQRVLSDSATPGHTNAYMMLEGVPLLGPAHLSSAFAMLQIAHLFWAAFCAVAVGALVWRMVGTSAAIVAQAVFLFSPFVLSSAFEPGMILIAPLCTVALLLLIFAVRDFGSAAALAAFGVVAGFSGTEPTVVFVALFLCAVMAWSVLQLDRFPWLVATVALLSCAAARLPDLPNLQTFATMAAKYTRGRGELGEMVMILFGQMSPLSVMRALESGHSGPFDIPLGALLSPFAIARSPMRLWGDVLIDPLGAALVAVGLVLALAHARRKRAAALLLGVLGLAFGQAFAASGDAVSHTRLAAALVPLAVFAGSAFEAIRRAFLPPGTARLAALGSAGLIAVSGIVIFAAVNPRILPQSWMTISLEALGTRAPNADALFLEHGGPYALNWWLHVGRIASMVPARPLAAINVEEIGQAQAASDEKAQPRVFFWSPGLEQDAHVSRLVCERWPGAALYALTDEPGLFRAWAAAPGGAIWKPRLPRQRWTVSPCPPS